MNFLKNEGLEGKNKSFVGEDPVGEEWAQGKRE
jgi:hypothetical protein